MNPWVILTAIVLLALVYVVAPVAAATVSYYRRPWRLTCPRARKAAQIRVGATRAAVAEVLGRREVAVERCSLWPAIGRNLSTMPTR